MPPIDFSKVLERSQKLAVVVDFWAPWCAPCRMLGPILDEYSAQSSGRWELVKINTDEQPDVAAALGVVNIPAVKMFHRGREVAEFVGLLPRDEVRRWLEASLPDPRQSRMDAILSGADPVRALEAFVEENPDFAPGRVRLALAVVVDDPARARELIDALPADPDLLDPIADVKGLADLMEPPEEVPAELAAHFEGARDALRSRDLDGALAHLVEAAMIDKRYGDELARRAAVALFRSLGQDHELTRKHQRRLAMVLHS